MAAAAAVLMGERRPQSAGHSQHRKARRSSVAAAVSAAESALLQSLSATAAPSSAGGDTTTDDEPRLPVRSCAFNPLPLFYIRPLPSASSRLGPHPPPLLPALSQRLSMGSLGHSMPNLTHLLDEEEQHDEEPSNISRNQGRRLSMHYGARSKLHNADLLPMVRRPKKGLCRADPPSLPVSFQRPPLNYPPFRAKSCSTFTPPPITPTGLAATQLQRIAPAVPFARAL